MKNQTLIAKISNPYAEALLGLAKDNNLIFEIKEDLSVILTTLQKSKDFQLFLTNPLISSIIKKDVVNKIFKNKINDLILKFLLILIDRRRIFLLNIIINKYLNLIYDLESITIAEVILATELNEVQQESLIEKIKFITNTKKVKLLMSIDSNLIGGFIIKIGSKIIDASIAGKLKQMSLYLMND